MAKTTSKAYLKRLAEQEVRDAEIQTARDARTSGQIEAERASTEEKQHKILLSIIAPSEPDYDGEGIRIDARPPIGRDGGL